MSPQELESLSAVAKTLNEESDDINKVISTLNEKLSAMNLGVTLYLSSDHGRYSFGFDENRRKPEVYLAALLEERGMGGRQHRPSRATSEGVPRHPDRCPQEYRSFDQRTAKRSPVSH